VTPSNADLEWAYAILRLDLQQFMGSMTGYFTRQLRCTGGQVRLFYTSSRSRVLQEPRHERRENAFGLMMCLQKKCAGSFLNLEAWILRIYQRKRFNS
jgi:hypothetical protein